MHVHVENADGEVKLWLDTLSVEQEHGRMKERDQAEVVRIAAARRGEIITKWQAEAARVL